MWCSIISYCDTLVDLIISSGVGGCAAGGRSSGCGPTEGQKEEKLDEVKEKEWNGNIHVRDAEQEVTDRKECLAACRMSVSVSTSM